MVKHVIQPFYGTCPRVDRLSHSLFLLPKKINLEKKIALFGEDRRSGGYAQDHQSSYYIYRIVGKEFNTFGLIGLVPHEVFSKNFVAPHEQTLQYKELDYRKSLLESRVQINPVLLFYRNNDLLSSLVALSQYQTERVFEVTIDCLKHEVLAVTDTKLINALTQACQGLDRLYVADGHHRIKASLMAAKKDKTMPKYCLSMLASADAIKVGSINRCIKNIINVDLNHLLDRVSQFFDIVVTDSIDIIKHEYALYLKGKWHKLFLKKEFLEKIKGIESLDPFIVHNYLLKPVFLIQDQRYDEKLCFVPDSCERRYLEKIVASGTVDVAICIPPISIDELCDIAEEDSFVPPHSIYLQPKPLNGMICWEY